MNHIEHRVRERAYRIWIDEGKPDGRADLHWEMASELVAIEENGDLALEPNPLAPGEETLDGTEPVEPAEMMDNLGEFPTLTDQGEERTAPKARKPAARKTATVDKPEQPAPKRAAAKGAAKDVKASAPAARRKKPDA